MVMYVWIGIYVLCSAFALTLIKMGGNRAASLTLSDGIVDMRLGTLMIVGFVLYVVSFLISMAILPRFDLSFFYPVSAGLIYIFVCLFAFFFLKENFSSTKLIGLSLILAGIVVMNLKS